MRPMTRRRALSVGGAAAAAVFAQPCHARADGALALDDDFLWGVAGSGFQHEGDAPDSNWTRYIATGAVEPYQDSVRFIERYASDIALAAALGARVYRTSIEWARVQPQPDQWSEAAFARYEKIVSTIVAAGLKPMLTLDHWVYPGWAADYGAWRNTRMIDDWLANAQEVVRRFARYRPMWVTVNEPLAYIGTERRIGALGSDGEEHLMMDRLAQVHNRIYDVIHRLQRGAMVTSCLGFVPAHEQEVNDPYVVKVRDRFDFVGVDYYFGPDTTHPYYFGVHLPPPDMRGESGMWEMPLQNEGIYYALRHYARMLPGKPLYVVENGMPTENGKPRLDHSTRADHLRDTIYWLQRASADGMNVIGYNYWSLTDNYEWGSYTPRFGLYTVDVDTDPDLTRQPTDAVEAFRAVTRDGGVPADYQPTRAPLACSHIESPDRCDDPMTAEQ